MHSDWMPGLHSDICPNKIALEIEITWDILKENTPVPHLYHLPSRWKKLSRTGMDQKNTAWVLLFVSFYFFFFLLFNLSHMCIFWSLFMHCPSLPPLPATSSAQHNTKALLWDSLLLLWLCCHCFGSAVFLNKVKLFWSTEKYIANFVFHIQSKDCVTVICSGTEYTV